MNIVLVGNLCCRSRAEIEGQLPGRHHFTLIHDLAGYTSFTKELETAEVIVGWPLNQQLLSHCRHVRFIQLAGAGIDGLNFARLPADTVVANTFHHETAIAEYIVMMMLVLLRRPFEAHLRLISGNWDGSSLWGEPPSMGQLRGANVLVIGTGRIGRELARRLSGFGAHILGVFRSTRPEIDHFTELLPFNGWGTHLRRADFVVPTCPLTDATRGMLGRPEFEAMKRTAYLINISRGAIVDEESLYDALRSKSIAGAALDVWYRYPSTQEDRVLPSRFPFEELDNVVMSPHHSGWTTQTVESRLKEICGNVTRFIEGHPLINSVKLNQPMP